MSSGYPALRLVRDEELAAPARAPADPAAAAAPHPVEQQLDALQQEMEHLRAEIKLLRHRDETLNFSMNRIDEELRLAAKLQQDFLPKSMPTLGNVRFHTLYRPAGYVSGDLYDIVRLDERHVGFYMADAVGHGMPAALLTMFIKNALVTKEIAEGRYRLLDPAESLTRLNEAMVEQNLSQATFATAVYGIIDTQSLVLTYARAGHPHPILMRSDGALLELDADGGLLGIFSGEQFESRSVQLASGDRLFVYTDGVELAFGDAAADSEHWRQELRGRRLLDTAKLISDLTENLDGVSGSLTPRDDLTMVVAEVL
ncbi:MAG TPA: PP2C family protein-serine/threonine phosphatase [Tepidisphaeraceae bacterium]|nr:PP2C family protein-serine/threonine phosphatase [Tepidisphaeraceae bacterium]